MTPLGALQALKALHDVGAGRPVPYSTWVLFRAEKLVETAATRFGRHAGSNTYGTLSDLGRHWLSELAGAVSPPSISP